VESVVFSDLLIKFFQNKGNYLNRLHSVITQKNTVLQLYAYNFIPTVLICIVYYMDRYTGLCHLVW